MRTAVTLICIGALPLAGCASMGPPTIVRDRFDYVTAISDSWKRQTLLNLLKIRYADAPVFMEVTSVISGYSLGADIRVGGQVARPGRGDAFAGAEASAQYADRPTITYQPLSGERFARSLMAPIPISGILFLIQSGYPADLVLRICVNSINGLENDYGGSGNPRAGSPKFRALMNALRASQAAGGAGFRTRSTRDSPNIVMFFRPPSSEVEPPAYGIRELLGLDPVAREFTFVYGSFPESSAEIAVLTRSIFQVMIDLAAQIEVPAADIDQGRVYSPQRTAEQERDFPPLVTVSTSSDPPQDAYVAVQYRGQWFWIDDRDRQSKQTLTFLMMMFSLTEGAPTQASPVVTIPAR